MSTLFATTVMNAKPQAKDYKLSDGGGLYLLVRPNGAKLWRLNYRYFEKGRMLHSGHSRRSAWPMHVHGGTKRVGCSRPDSIPCMTCMSKRLRWLRPA